MTKLMSSFFIVLCMAGSISFEGISKLGEINSNQTLTYNRDIVGLIEVSQADQSFLKATRAIRSAIIYAGDQNAVSSFQLEFQKNMSAAEDHIAKAEPLFIRPEGKALLAKAQGLAAEYSRSSGGLLDAAMRGDSKTASTILKGISAKGTEIITTMDQAQKQKEQVAEDMKNHTQETYSNARTVMITLATSTCLIGFVITYLIARSVSNPLRETVNVLECMSAGNLTVRLKFDTADEVGLMAARLNHALDSICASLQDVSHTATMLSNTSAQLASTSNSLSKGAGESAAALQETSASLEEMTATVRQNADNAKQASTLTTTASDHASQSASVVTDAISAMAEINTSSRKIADITARIDEIAFQTNLLAVNAEIEAALAGEHGRGFSIVAQEVRDLARRCKTAAKEVKSLIADSVEKVGSGSQLVNKSGQALKDIFKSVNQTANVVNEISAASSEQTIGIEQINGAMSQMSAVAQTSSEQTERVHAAALEVSQQAQHLKELLLQFELPTGSLQALSANLGKSQRPGVVRKKVPTAA